MECLAQIKDYTWNYNSNITAKLFAEIAIPIPSQACSIATSYNDAAAFAVIIAKPVFEHRNQEQRTHRVWK